MTEYITRIWVKYTISPLGVRRPKKHHLDVFDVGEGGRVSFIALNSLLWNPGIE